MSALFSFESFAMDEWETVSAAEAGFRWDVGEGLDSAFENGELKNLHSVVIVRNGRLVFERYYKGPDQDGGYPLGDITFTPDTLHDVQSINKSIVSLLYGIALAEGKVPDIETPLVDAFPEYGDLVNDPDRRRIKIKHALSMTMGLEWNAVDFPYSDVRNSWYKMEHAPDRYRFVLSLPIVAEPGAAWSYTTGASRLLAEIISRGVGVPLVDYAREKLFHPLSITDVGWHRGRDGKQNAGRGLRMKPRDLAKIGQLVLNNGRWKDVQLVSSEWLASSFVESTTTYEKYKYGYQWWLGRLQKSNDKWVYGAGTGHWIAGLGYGDQGLIIIPVYQLVIVVTAGNYNLAKQSESELPWKVLLEFVLPALTN